MYVYYIVFANKFSFFLSQLCAVDNVHTVRFFVDLYRIVVSAVRKEFMNNKQLAWNNCV